MKKYVEYVGLPDNNNNGMNLGMDVCNGPRGPRCQQFSTTFYIYIYEEFLQNKGFSVDNVKSINKEEMLKMEGGEKDLQEALLLSLEEAGPSAEK